MEKLVTEALDSKTFTFNFQALGANQVLVEFREVPGQVTIGNLFVVIEFLLVHRNNNSHDVRAFFDHRA